MRKTFSSLAALVAVLLFLALPANAANVTCPDGSIWFVSPFNSDPCKNLETSLAADEYPIDFLLIFGEPPAPSGNSLRDRIAREAYRRSYVTYQGEVAPPAEFPFEFYSIWGLDVPYFYRTQYGDFVRWPDAFSGQPCQAFLSTARLGPAVVVASCQSRAILNNGCILRLQEFVPTRLRKLNDAQCAAGDE